MGENYKDAEKAHYDHAVETGGNAVSDKISLSDKVLRSSHLFFMQRLDKLFSDGPVKVLDYGCGPGMRLLDIAKPSVQIVGIDISPKSIEFANKMGSSKGLNAHFEVMDCEKTTFPDDSFDIVADYGTFSSLNIRNAVPEVARILKPGGTLVSIETFGHNPFSNFKRTLNVLLGQRTRWAAYHIMKQKDWEYAASLFEIAETEYFGLTVLFVVPFLKIMPESWHNNVIKVFEGIDKSLLRKKFFQKYAFKTVVVLSCPKKAE
jgi:ubiquinone/menaquinone biosynthesis C-methylase UbiE